MNGAQIAPAGIARVASWPLDVLSGFSDGALADQADAALDGRFSWPAFEAAYNAAAAVQRERLWTLTRGDGKFLLALAFVNPGLTKWLTSISPESLSIGRRQRLDKTLYRYLARAAGRTQPLGLWAGVSLVRWARTTRIAPAAPALRVEPDLRPLFAIVLALASRPAYRQRGPWQVNPSLGDREDGSWTFWAVTPRGTEERAVRRGFGIETLLQRLARCGPQSLDALADAVESWGLSRGVAVAALEALTGAGLLVGGLQPPWRFETPTEALALIEDALVAPDRGAWRAGRVLVETCCRQLEDRGDTLDVAAVLAAGDTVQRAIRDLAANLGLACPVLPEALLRCDLKSPVEIELGEDVRSRLEQTLAQYLRFQGAYGFGPPIRGALLAHYVPAGQSVCQLKAVPAPPATAPTAAVWEELGVALGARDDFAGRLARWQGLLTTESPSVVASEEGDSVAPQFGWLHASFDAPPGRFAQMIVHGVFDDLWGPYARHAPFWTSNSAPDALQEWLRRGLSEAAAESDVTLAEIVAPSHGNPNALARPRLGQPIVSPWSCWPGALDLREAAVVIDPRDGIPFLALPGRLDRIAVLNAASADIQSADPVAQVLLATSLGATPGPMLHAASVVFAQEVDAARCSPEVTLPAGAIVRTRRSVLGGATVQAWCEGSAARRFAEWTRLARCRGWPAWLLARRQDGLTLPLHRDSPLAVAALFERAGGHRLTIEQLAGGAWIDDGTRARVAELAIPFRRGEHIWSRRP